MKARSAYGRARDRANHVWIGGDPGDLPGLRSNSGAVYLEQLVPELRFTSAIATSSSGPGQQRSRMSGPGDDRWRGGRPYDPNRPNQRHSTPGPRDRTGPQGGHRGAHGANSPNAWGAQQVPSGPPQEQHIPVRGFNAAESKGALRRGPGEPKPTAYKPTGKEVNNRASGPWGSKPNTMANGKDFFLELRKQVSALQQGGNVAGG
ncbi:hypothetical protein DTO164E3_213 [Paecilomyces variotii]|nr:hypothetical protein DTO032I3_8393 [Paecilomyces variotii]KAJ9207927.1 hypothetical protein DTO164E3_213 [Paecilomyces variotii]KAJ9227376.1 hypothetical protein DTO169C6_17 [Paecilomyces variotii]KAJ9246066.1 hypothetical protein DTO169E5_190 [Paecilomyces variotii]KAJ9260429.1 hypothetical protein DTO207G8_474 [Paecilomyces variotii]